MALCAEPLQGAELGRRVTGVDLARPLDGTTRAALQRLLDEHGLLVFPGRASLRRS
jgi:alpha-ketoglutarate-dependent taurine dioxygenase